VEVDAIAKRPGWDAISAVRMGQIHELDGADVLAPGPSLIAGLRQIHEIVQAFQATA
jgi:ABC-type Fe3+-hydroxamate transport system substrate-binding protein